MFVVLFHGLICQPNIGTYVFPDTQPSDGEYIIVNLGKDIKFTTILICKENSLFNKFWQENGFVENLQSIILFFSIILIIKYRKIYKGNLLIRIFLIIYIIGLIYYFGEISWGQHFFKWNTPEFFENYNNQNETNIHNISNLFDQLPRTLVLLFCGIIAPFTIILQKYIKINKDILYILCPDRKLLIISITLIFFNSRYTN